MQVLPLRPVVDPDFDLWKHPDLDFVNHVSFAFEFQARPNFERSGDIVHPEPQALQLVLHLQPLRHASPAVFQSVFDQEVLTKHSLQIRRHQGSPLRFAQIPGSCPSSRFPELSSCRLLLSRKAASGSVVADFVVEILFLKEYDRPFGTLCEKIRTGMCASYFSNVQRRTKGPDYQSAF